MKMNPLTNVAEILAALRAQGVEARGMSADSRTIKSGDVFAAMPGLRTDGRTHIADALARGAVAVVWEAQGVNAAPLSLEHIPHVPVIGLQRLAGALAHEIYGRPSEQLCLCGITGTNGKTSVSQWIAQAFAAMEQRCGLIGTLGVGFPDALEESANTTPDAIRVHATIAGLHASGASACAMEVSSIGLDQGRVNGAHFDTVVFTNLTRDHLEYHGNMINYGTAKARLFEFPNIRTAVLNLDDPLGLVLADHLAGRAGVHRIGYTLDAQSPHAQRVDTLLMARELTLDGEGMHFQLDAIENGLTTSAFTVVAPLLGRFNASNLLAVLGALMGAKVSLDAAVKSCAHLQPPPGRLQKVSTGDGLPEPLVVVDYAHTPDALEQALVTLREVAKARGGRVCCVFGCGGDRDAGKRPLMGRVVDRYADVTIVTSDNPRSEDAQKIIRNILDGMKEGTDSEVDRAGAIARMMQSLEAPDVLLIAGKGHELYQEIAGQRVPYSDLDEARAALAAWRASA